MEFLIVTEVPVVTLPLAGRVREGGDWPGYRGSQHPLPASPVEGEVPLSICGTKVPLHV